MFSIYQKMDEAIQEHDIKTFMKLYTDNDFDIKNNFYSSFRLAVQEEFTEAIHIFLENKDVNVNVKNGEALRKTIVNRNWENFITLLKHKDINPAIDHCILLKEALNIEHYEMAEELYDILEVRQNASSYFPCKLKNQKIIDFYLKLKIKHNLLDF